MNIRIPLPHAGLLLLTLWAVPLAGLAQEPAAPPPEQAHPAELPAAIEKAQPPKAPPATPAVSTPQPAQIPEPEASVAAGGEDSGEPAESGAHRQAIVSVGHDSKLPAGEKAEAVISIFGTATNDGEVSQGVVAVFGDTFVNGPTGEGAVAILGDLHVNSKVAGDAVVVLGDLDLGPNAEIDGETVVIGGTLTRAASAVTRGGVEQILGGHFGSMQWLRPWFRHCLLLGRPLALEPGLEWAWGLAFGFLALYALLALMFRSGVEKCIDTFERQPGRTVLASLLALVLSPVMFFVLAITVVGLVLFPFALFCVGLFGKAAILALIGKRITRLFGDDPILNHPAVGVLLGGLIVTALYLVPFVGFIVYKLLGVLALGVVAYTLILTYRSNDRLAAQAAASTPAAAAPAAAAAGFAAEAATAGVAAEPAPAGAPLSAPPPAEALVTDVMTLARAGFWVRMGALFIDLVLIGVATGLLHGLGDVFLLVVAVYGAVMWKLKGTTVGGIVFGLKVARLDGRPVDWATSIVRALGCFLSMAVAGLGFIWIVFDEERQAWHDKIAGTVVVRVPKGVSLV